MAKKENQVPQTAEKSASESGCLFLSAVFGLLLLLIIISLATFGDRTCNGAPCESLTVLEIAGYRATIETTSESITKIEQALESVANREGLIYWRLDSWTAEKTNRGEPALSVGLNSGDDTLVFVTNAAFGNRLLLGVHDYDNYSVPFLVDLARKIVLELKDCCDVEFESAELDITIGRRQEFMELMNAT